MIGQYYKYIFKNLKVFLKFYKKIFFKLKTLVPQINSYILIKNGNIIIVNNIRIFIINFWYFYLHR